MQVRVVADADWIPDLDDHVDGVMVRVAAVDPADADADVIVAPMAVADRVIDAFDGDITIPVVWVVPKRARRSEMERLSAAASGSRFIFDPDARALAAAVRELAGARERRRAEERGEASAPGSSMEDLWQQFRGTMFDRLEVVESVGAEILEDRLQPDRLEAAHTAAHKLHGSLGTFGLHHGSDLASELEELLEAAMETGAMPPGDRYRYSELAMGIRQEVEVGRPVAGDRAAGDATIETAGTLLIVESDPDRREDLGAGAMARGWRPERVSTAGEALDRLAEGARPQLAVLDPGAGEPELLERLLTTLAEEPDPVPVVFQGRTRRLEERLQAVTLGARVFVDREASVDAVLGRAESLLEEERTGDARILVVDDDPAVLRVLGFTLRGAGFRVRTLSSPLEFWNTLEAVEPDLLLLDVNMPDVNGYQLCRAVRADTRWDDLPILFLTARSSPEDVVAGFEAGGDDFVAKPVAGPELLARIENRLTRLGQAHIRDHETGLSSRRIGVERLDVQVAIAGRCGHAVTVALIRLAGPGSEELDHEIARLSNSLHGEARQEDVVARWGKYEVMVSRYDEEASATHRWLARHLPQGAGRARVGLATFPDDGRNVESVLDQAAADQAGRRARMTPAAPGSGKGPMDADIVIVEDDEALGALLMQTLDDRGYNTHWIRDGAEAAELLAGSDPAMRASLIILDVGLPGMDGLSLLRQLARDRVTRRTRVLMLTARSAESEVVKALELGAFDHVPKPFSVSELLHRVRRAVGDRGGT